MTNEEMHQMSWGIAKRVFDSGILSENEFALMCWHMGLNAKDF